MAEFWSKFEPSSDFIVNVPAGSFMPVELNTTVGSTSTYTGLQFSLTDDCYHHIDFYGEIVGNEGCQALAVGFNGDFTNVTSIELQSVDGTYTIDERNSYDSQSYYPNPSEWGLRFLIATNPSDSSVLYVAGKPNNIHEGWHKLIFHSRSTSWYTMIYLTG